MNYVILNSDGSLLLQNIEYYIQQGNSGDTIFVALDEVENTDVAIAVCTLPNQTQNTIAGVYGSEDITIDGETETYYGFTFTLTTSQTNYGGLLQLAVRINRGSTILVSYPIALVINETGVRPDTDTGITIEELNSYLLQLENYALTSYVDTQLAKKVDKVTPAMLADNETIAYVAFKSSGVVTQGRVTIAGSSATPWTIPTRRGNGEIVVGSPTENSHAVNLSYANSHYLALTGGTLSGNLNFGYQYSIQLYSGFIRNNSTTLFGIGTDEGNRTYYAFPQGAVSSNPNGANNPLVLATQNYVDDAIQSLGTVFNYRGSKTVAEINLLPDSTFVSGDVYNVSDSGTLTKGNVTVVAGDNVVWDGTGWDKLAGTIDLSGYVQKTQTIAGIDLQDNITASELASAINDELDATNTTTDVDYIMGVE